jgi:hypothetical protein
MLVKLNQNSQDMVTLPAHLHASITWIEELIEVIMTKKWKDDRCNTSWVISQQEWTP